MYRGPNVATKHHEEDREEEECTVFQREMKEEPMLDSRSNSSEQSLEEEASQPSLSFVTVEDEVIGVGEVVEEEGEREESGDEEDGKVEARTLKVEEKRKEKEEEDEEEGIHLHFKMDTTLRAKDRVYISSYGNQV